jgi:sugar phosphate isomerase/epimerase
MSVQWGKLVNNQVDIIKAALDGFDCIEITIDYVMNNSDEQFILQKNLILQNNLIPKICSSVLPRNVLITEKGFNLYVWMEYLKKAIHRLSELGCQTLVWSDGRARVLPWEGDTSEKKEQVLQFLHMLCELSRNWGITVLIEPLSPRRTNYLNSMKEIDEFLPLVRKDNLYSMISLRELTEIDLPPESFLKYPHLIKHVHMENPLHMSGKRVAPRSGDEYDYSSFLSALQSINYDAVITLPEDADSESLQYCRKIWPD